MAGGIAHQAFDCARRAYFGRRQHLLQPVAMLEPGKQRLRGVPRLAPDHIGSVDLLR